MHFIFQQNGSLHIECSEWWGKIINLNPINGSKRYFRVLYVNTLNWKLYYMGRTLNKKIQEAYLKANVIYLHDTVLKLDTNAREGCVSVGTPVWIFRVHFIIFSPVEQQPPAGSGPPQYPDCTITLSWSPLDEWSARWRDLNWITHNTQKRQTSMPRWDSNSQSQ